MATLPQALGTSIPKMGMRMPPAPPAVPAPPPPDPGAGFETLAQAKQEQLQPLQQRIAGAEAEQMKLGTEKAQFQVQQQAKQATGELGIQQAFQQRTEQAPLRGELEQKVQQEKDFFFRPSREDGMQMAALASLIAVVGTSLGKGGKGNAMAALSGLNGMMEGYQKGRDDIFRQEKTAFETNAKALSTQIGNIRKALEDYEKMAVRDRETATLQLRESLAREGADFLAARAEREGAVRLLPELRRTERQLQQEVSKYQGRAEDARTKAQASQQQYEQRLDLENRREEQRRLRQEARDAVVNARMAAREAAVAGRAEQKTEKARTMSDAQVVKIEGMSSVANGLEKLKRTFKPEFASLGFLGFGADLEVEARRRLGDAVGMEAARWWAAYNRLQAPNRHALFGATLTGNELKNYQSFTAKPSDAPEFVVGQLDDQIAYANDVRETRVATYEAAGYRVPPRPVTDFERTLRGGALPPPAGGAPAAAAPAGAPKEGDKATSKSGRPMVYRGGQWVYE